MLQILSMACAALFILLTSISGVNAAGNEFTGTKSCVTCHEEQYQAWQGSHHDLAMQHAGFRN
jgi:nitrate/TMAO reductase-like tetraheme cytochrome c subunit